jgi:outer membrane protein assembly factor BamB
MPHGITRREFLRYAAAAAGSLWLASLANRLPYTAQGAMGQVNLPSPTFTALPSPTLLGAPADVSIGADGVYWSIAESGAPFTYDPVDNVWQPFGGGIDATAYIPFVDSNENFSVSLCFFRGGEVYKSGDPGPVPIAQLWPNLPPSFQQGVDGATYMSGNLFYLFRQGQAASVDVWGEVSVAPLTSFGGAGWPGGDWQDGMFDFVFSGKDDTFASSVILVRGEQYIVLDMYQALITGAPQPLSALFGGATLTLLTAGGVAAMLCPGPVQATDAPLQVFGGPVVYALPSAQSSAPAQAAYLAQEFAPWPSAWHPVLRQAPSGSGGALWAVTEDGQPVVNDTTGWNPAALPNNTPAVAVDSGSDGSVCAISAGALFQWGANGGWTQAAASSFALQDVSVGDAEHIWALDNQGNVYRFQNGGLAPVNLGVTATDIKANADGTLWHCSAGQANVYRYISEGQLPSEAIAVGLNVTSVQKATASNFGAALFLAQQAGQPAIIRYTSPYLFKTSASYSAIPMQRIAVGGASIFLTAVDPANNAQVFSCALDVQTGAEQWRYSYPAGSNNIYGFAPLYDPQQRLVYVCQYSGVIDALDAHTGAQRWSLQLGQGQVIATQPVLAEGTIYVAATDDPNASPFSMMVYLTAIDTGAAASRAAAGQPVQATWVSPISVAGQSPMLPLPPVYYEGFVYQCAWSLWNQPSPQLQINGYQVDPATGSANTIFNIALAAWPAFPPPTVEPVVAQLLMPPQYTQAAPALVVNAGSGLYGFFLNNSEYIPTYTPPTLTSYPSYTNLVLFDGVIYFADNFGNLYGVDAGMNATANTPVQLVGGEVYAPLTVTAGADGSAMVIVGDAWNNQLLVFSPASGNILTLPTGQTGFMSMSEVTGDSLLYGGGVSASNLLGQVFGIRTDDLSALRDFVIESQMMQDYDPGAAAVARYQIHITIVDDQKTPQPYTGVKIWADDPITLLVDGQSFDIGPNTPVATQVDAAGSLSLAANTSDIFATPLRLLAAFMDPSERIVIYPDREFHTRLPAMVADPNNDDPTTINLATGTNYAGTTVFSDQKQAQSTAQAVTAVCNATGLGNNTASVLRFAVGQSSATRYTAYDDLPSMAYFPYNTDATRVPVVQSPYGLSWSQDVADYSVLPFAGAASAIDALTGAPDDSLTGPLGSWFSSLWDKIKSGVAKIGKIIISAGQSIYIGIQYVVDGVTHVLRHLIRDVDDLAAMVGAFFVALGKALENIIELLSLLLHFEEVVKTHNILKTALLTKINNLPNDITNYGQPALSWFFDNTETAIANVFCTIKKNFDASVNCGGTASAIAATPANGSPAINSLNGAGSTAHTVFRVTPKNGGAPASHTVYATWGFNKAKNHFQKAQATATLAPGDDPFSGFLNSFTSSLSTNPALQQALTQTKSDFAATFNVSSSSQFLQMAIVDLLDIFQDLMIGSLAITNAFMNGLLKLGADLVTLLFDPDTGLLTQPLNIPILSDLYQLLFDSQLSFFDLMVLVASIPVTFLYRIIEGAWFSDQYSAPATSGPLALTPLARAMGLMNGSLYFGRLVFMPIADAISMGGSANPILFRILTGISVGLQVTATLTGSGTPASNPAGWVIYMVGCGLVFAPFLGSAIAPATSSFLALTRMGAYVFQKADPSVDISWVAFGGDLMGVLPPFAQPVKYLAQTLPITARVVMIAIDVIGNYGAAAVAIAETALNWDTAPTNDPPTPEPPGPARLFIPFVGADGNGT